MEGDIDIPRVSGRCWGHRCVSPPGEFCGGDDLGHARTGVIINGGRHVWVTRVPVRSLLLRQTKAHYELPITYVSEFLVKLWLIGHK